MQVFKEKSSQLNKFYVSMEKKSKYMLLKYKLSISVDFINFDPQQKLHRRNVVILPVSEIIKVYTRLHKTTQDYRSADTKVFIL